MRRTTKIAASLFVVLMAGFGLASPDAALGGPGSALVVTRVTDRSGKPISSARVTLRETEYVTLHSGGYLDSGGTTDNSGEVSFSRFRKCRGRYLLSVSHPEFAEFRLRDVHIPLLGRRIDVTLLPGARISGRVIDPSGEPVPCARVELRRPGRAPGLSALTRHTAFALDHAPTTTSDATGRFALRRVPEGVHGILASTPGAIGWRTGIRVDSSEIVVRLKPCTTIVMTGADARLVGSGGLLSARDAPLRYPLRVDEKSEVRAERVPAGVYYLTLGGPFPHVRDTVDVPVGAPLTLRRRLPPVLSPRRDHLIDGLVLNEEGKPADGAWVVAVSLRVDEMRACGPASRTGAGGRFALDCFSGSSGEVRIIAMKDGTWGSVDLTLPTDAPASIALDKSGLRFKVRIVSEDREPVANARVSLDPSALMPLPSTPTLVTSVDGETDWVEGLLPGSALAPPQTSEEPAGAGEEPLRRIRISIDASPGYLKDFRTVPVSRGKIVIIPLKAAPSRIGTVLDSAGRPAAGIRVLSGTAGADTDARGRFHLFGTRRDEDLSILHWSPLPPGLTSPGVFPRLSDSLRIPDARRSRLELLGGSDLEGCAVRIDAAQARHRTGCPQAFVDQEGRAIPGVVLPGDYVVTVFSGQGSPATAVPVVQQNIRLEPDPPDGVWRVQIGR